MSFFEHVEEAPLDPILGITIRYKQDPREGKVDLGAGVYKSADLKSYILNTVKEAEAQILEKETSKDYLPIDGLAEYVQQTAQLVFGKEAMQPHIYGSQTTGGTAALCIIGIFLKELGLHTIYLSAPTWQNHSRIFQRANLHVQSYPYFNWEKKAFDFAALVEAIERMPKRSILFLQGCCHNPTGCDPTIGQWEEIAELVQKKELFAFFDFAYQGFGDGLEEDAAPLRLFLEKRVECAVAVSHAKNFGIYAERCGALFIICQNESCAKKVGSRVKVIARSLYSTPPAHGARIVASILQNEVFKAQWKNELDAMRNRIKSMRKALVEGLQGKIAPHAFQFLISQKGMFSYTGLTESQVGQLIANYGIYLPKDGRINIAGLNEKNLVYITDAIAAIYNDKKLDVQD